MSQDNQIKPSFYAVIPANVRYCNKLCANAKLLYAEITSLCEKEGYCWASNEYFANLDEVNDRTIRRWLNELEYEGFIKRNEFVENGKTKRKIFIIQNNFRADKNVQRGGQKCPGGADKNAHQSLKHNTKNKEVVLEEQQQEGKAASPVVVFLSLKDLEVAEPFKVKISKKYSEAQVDLAIERLKTIANVVTIEATLYHLLNHPEEWKDKPKKEDIISKNMNFLEDLRNKKIDGRSLSNTRVDLGNEYVEFIRGGVCLEKYTIDQIDFEKLVRAFIGKLKGCRQAA
jgi:hypothetical protein